MSGKDYLPASDVDFTYTCAKEIQKVSHGRGNHDEVSEWNEELISTLVSPVMKTIEISDLMKEIPEKRYEKILCSTPKAYLKMLYGYGAKNRSQAVYRAREVTDGFVYEDGIDGKRETRELEDKPKLKELVRQCEKYCHETEPAEKVVVWVNFQGSQKLVKEKLESEGFKVACLFSDMSSVEMGIEQEKFTKGEAEVFVCSASISEGMNLQEASRIEIFFSNSFSPVKREQAEGRVYRPGQRRQTLIIDLLCAETLDEKLLELLKEHKEKSEAFILSELEKTF